MAEWWVPLSECKTEEIEQGEKEKDVTGILSVSHLDLEVTLHG